MPCTARQLVREHEGQRHHSARALETRASKSIEWEPPPGEPLRAFLAEYIPDLPSLIEYRMSEIVSPQAYSIAGGNHDSELLAAVTRVGVG